MNLDLHARIIKEIRSNPEGWDNGKWHCKTTHCYAGFAQILSGTKPDRYSAANEARIALGLNESESRYMFAANRTLAELERGPVYDVEGFLPDGFDVHGFSRNGYDRDGYDEGGRDCQGRLRPTLDTFKPPSISRRAAEALNKILADDDLLSGDHHNHRSPV